MGIDFTQMVACSFVSCSNLAYTYNELFLSFFRQIWKYKPSRYW